MTLSPPCALNPLAILPHLISLFSFTLLFLQQNHLILSLSFLFPFYNIKRRISPFALRRTPNFALKFSPGSQNTLFLEIFLQSPIILQYFFNGHMTTRRISLPTIPLLLILEPGKTNSIIICQQTVCAACFLSPMFILYQGTTIFAVVFLKRNKQTKPRNQL